MRQRGVVVEGMHWAVDETYDIVCRLPSPISPSSLLRIYYECHGRFPAMLSLPISHVRYLREIDGKQRLTRGSPWWRHNTMGLCFRCCASRYSHTKVLGHVTTSHLDLASSYMRHSACETEGLTFVAGCCRHPHLHFTTPRARPKAPSRPL
jgi:hypothetical protein